MAKDINDHGITQYPELHLDNQLCFSLYSLSRKVIQNYTPLLKPLGLTYPQYLVMLVMWQGLEVEQLGLAVSQLTEKLKLDTGTVTPLLKRMEAKGLLSRQRSEQDERIVIVSLTAEGRALRDAAKHIPQALLCQAKAGLGDDESAEEGVQAEQLITLRETLKAMLKSLA
ncbi:MAG: MarR family transcriptional regulator [Oleispira sp.]